MLPTIELSQHNIYYHSCNCPYNIYELIKINDAMRWDNLGKFGTRIQVAEYKFPQIITPMNNGKFIFFPKSITSRHSVYEISEPFEVWEKNQTFLSRLPMELPLNLTSDLRRVLIFQV